MYLTTSKSIKYTSTRGAASPIHSASSKLFGETAMKDDSTTIESPISKSIEHTSTRDDSSHIYSASSKTIGQPSINYNSTITYSPTWKPIGQTSTRDDSSHIYSASLKSFGQTSIKDDSTKMESSISKSIIPQRGTILLTYIHLHQKHLGKSQSRMIHLKWIYPHQTP